MSARNKQSSFARTSTKTIPLHLLSAPSRAHTTPQRGEQSYVVCTKALSLMAPGSDRLHQFIGCRDTGTISGIDSGQSGGRIILRFLTPADIHPRSRHSSLATQSPKMASQATPLKQKKWGATFSYSSVGTFHLIW